MNNLNNYLKHLESNFLKQKPTTKKKIVYTDLNDTLGIESFENIILEVYGDSGVGKTNMIYQTISNLQYHEKELCIFVNAEFSFYSSLAQSHGIKLENLILINPENVDILFHILSKVKNAYIFIDSIAALNLSENQINTLIGLVRGQHRGLIYTNQLRWKGCKISSSGKKLLKYYTDIRLQFTKSHQLIIKKRKV